MQKSTSGVLLAAGLTLGLTFGLPAPRVESQSPIFGAQTPLSIAGMWDSTEGTITFQQVGANVTGSYTQDNGAFEGMISENVLTGYWIEDNSARRCDTPRNGRHHWGRIRFVFDGSSFQGLWGYCDEEPSRPWTGNRVGDDVAVVPQVPPPVSIAGVWDSTEGTITFQQVGANVTGSYTQDNGAFEGMISENVLTGYWIEDNSARRCDTPRNGRHHWGRIRFVFDGSSFQGLWGYCNDEPSSTWTGTRR